MRDVWIRHDAVLPLVVRTDYYQQSQHFHFWFFGCMVKLPLEWNEPIEPFYCGNSAHPSPEQATVDESGARRGRSGPVFGQ